MGSNCSIGIYKSSADSDRGSEPTRCFLLRISSAVSVEFTPLSKTSTKSSRLCSSAPIRWQMASKTRRKTLESCLLPRYISDKNGRLSLLTVCANPTMLFVNRFYLEMPFLGSVSLCSMNE